MFDVAVVLKSLHAGEDSTTDGAPVLGHRLGVTVLEVVADPGNTAELPVAVL